MNCDQATGLLRRLASGDQAGEAEPTAALLDHLADCPACLEEVAVLATAAGGVPSRLMSEIYGQHGCALVERLLPEWAQLQLDGGDPAERDPAAWAHLQSCAACRDSLTELRGLLQAAVQGELGPLPSAQPWAGVVFPAALHLNDPGGKLAVDLVLRRSAGGTLEAEVSVDRADRAPLEQGFTVSVLDRNRHPLASTLVNEVGRASLAGLDERSAYLDVQGAGQKLTLPLALDPGAGRTGDR